MDGRFSSSSVVTKALMALIDAGRLEGRRCVDEVSRGPD
jgi:hypothetical protein